MLHTSFIWRADRVEEIGVSAESVAVSVDILLHLLVVLELVFPGARIVVGFSALKSVQH